MGFAPSVVRALEQIQKYKGVWWFCNHFLPIGVLNSFIANAVITWGDSFVGITTGAAVDARGWVRKLVDPSLGATWDKKRHLMAMVTTGPITSNYTHIVSGAIASLTTSGNNTHHVGFKIINGTLYGTVADGTAESTLEIEVLPAGWLDRKLEVVFTPGVEIRFYVDDVDKGTISTNLPTGTTNARPLLNMSICAKAAAVEEIYLNEVRVLQEE